MPAMAAFYRTKIHNGAWHYDDDINSLSFKELLKVIADSVQKCGKFSSGTEDSYLRTSSQEGLLPMSMLSRKAEIKDNCVDTEFFVREL